MIILLLAEFTPQIIINDCFAPSTLNILPRSEQIGLFLNPLEKKECEIFNTGIQFTLHLKTATTTLKPLFTRSKNFIYGKKNNFIFTSTEDLETVIQATLMLDSMTHSTQIQIGTIYADFSIPEVCFKDVFLNVSGNETVLDLTPTGACDYLDFPIESVEVPEMGLLKLPELTNNSVFLSGFDELKVKLKVKFEGKLGVIDDFQRSLFDMQVKIDGTSYLIQGEIESLVGDDFAEFGSDFQAIAVENDLVVFFTRDDAIFDLINDIQVSQIQVQISYFRGGKMLHVGVNYSNFAEIINNFTIPCYDECNFNSTLQLDVKSTEFFASNFIEVMDNSSFSGAEITFPGDKIRIGLQKIISDELFQMQLQVSIQVQDLNLHSFLFITDEMSINDRTEYLISQCHYTECQRIKEIFNKQQQKQAQIEFNFPGVALPADLIIIDYQTSDDFEFVQFAIIFLSSMAVCVIWGCFQLLYLDRRVDGAKVEKKVKKSKVQCDEL